MICSTQVQISLLFGLSLLKDGYLKLPKWGSFKGIEKTGMFDVWTFDWGKGNNSYLNKNDTLLTYWGGFNLTFQK